jgi:hypothetical protein
MTEYKTFIDSIYGTITDNTKNDTEKSEIVIDGIQRVMSNSKSTNQSKKTNDSKISCSNFSNTIVQFVCKLDKNKDKLCNIPSTVAWLIGKEKINTVIGFITTNDAFVKSVWKRFQTSNDKDEIKKLLDNLANRQSKFNSLECIQNVETFLKKLIELSSSMKPLEVRPLSTTSTTSTTSLTSIGSSLTSGESRPSSVSSVGSSLMSGESRPSSVSSVKSSLSNLTDSEEILPSSLSKSSNENKRYGQRLLLSPISNKNPLPFTDEEKDYNNMWKDESQVYNPNNMWKNNEDWE